MPQPSSVQLFFACTQYAAATVAAAIKAGQFGSDSEHRRILVVSDTSASPELNTPLDRMSGFEPLRQYFDEVRSWNNFIRPYHPVGWSPRAQDALLWQRAIRAAWDLGDARVEIACESIQANPSQAAVTIFADSPVHIYADGLMSYGPTRKKLDPLIATRIRRLLHLDLVPGLEPLLLSEYGVTNEIVPSDVFLSVLTDIAKAVPPLRVASDAAALILGQYLSSLDILTIEEEQQLHIEMLQGAFTRGHRNIVFKPHPSAPVRWSHSLEAEAERLGAELTIMTQPVLAEVLYQHVKPALVVACFSTALLTASTLHGIPVARAGTELLLQQLTPYQNSNRVPLTIVDALTPPLEGHADFRPNAHLSELVKTVGFAMQPQMYPHLRPTAEKYLTEHLTPENQRYFKRRRLTALALPGGKSAQRPLIPRSATLRRVARHVRTLRKAALS